MEIDEFRAELLDSVKASAFANMEFDRMEYLTTVVNDLMEFDECPDCIPCYYEGIGRRNKKVEIHGYYFDETDGTFYSFYSDYDGGISPSAITKTELITIFNKVKAFIEESAEGNIQTNTDESNLGYELSLFIEENIQDIERFKVLVITDKPKSERIKAIDTPEIVGKQSSITLWDIVNYHELKISKLGYDETVINISDFHSNPIPCLPLFNNGDEYQSYLCSVPGAFLAKIYGKYGNRLLEANVRSFLTTRGKVNKMIRDTILKEPEKFFAFNNGITITASDIGIKFYDDRAEIESLTSMQIVNGGQTTASLYFTKTKDKTSLEGIEVPMKIIVLPPMKAEELIPMISRSSNTQNKVSEADFFSNHEFHRVIERLSRNTRAPAVQGMQYSTGWFYERARGQYQQEIMSRTPSEKEKFKLQNPKKQFFTKTDLAKFVNSYEQLPHTVSKGAQANFLKFAEKISTEWEHSNKRFDENYFKDCVSLGILFRQTERIVSNQDWYTGAYRANIVTYSIAKLSYMLEKDGKALNLNKIWTEQTIPPELERQIGDIAKIVHQVITVDSLGQNVTQYCKKAECWERVKNSRLSLNEDIHFCTVRESQDAAQFRQRRQTLKPKGDVNLIEVVNLGEDYWREIYAWGVENGYMGKKDQEIMRTAMNLQRKRPSERQAKYILEIRQRLIEEGYGVR